MRAPALSGLRKHLPTAGSLLLEKRRPSRPQGESRGPSAHVYSMHTWKESAAGTPGGTEARLLGPQCEGFPGISSLRDLAPFLLSFLCPLSSSGPPSLLRKHFRHTEKSGEQLHDPQHTHHQHGTHIIFGLICFTFKTV